MFVVFIDCFSQTIKVQQLPEYSIVHKPTKVGDQMCVRVCTCASVCDCANINVFVYGNLHLPMSFSLQAEGKVDNYTDLADIGPYPTKNPPQDRVQYTEVTPSDVSVISAGQ